jgi:CRISPR-associated protein Cas5d
MNIIQVKLSGDYALFNDITTPVERYTYPVPTFSAIKGCLESIYWKPEFEWQIISIQVLNEIKHQTFIRNEVLNQKVSLDKNFSGIVNNRTQRSGRVLLNPEYIVTAKIVQKEHDQANIHKHYEIFNRRIVKGQCFRQPYFGQKEFVCYFSAPDGNEKVHESLIGEFDLGVMLSSIEYGQSIKPQFSGAKMVDGLVTLGN